MRLRPETHERVKPLDILCGLPVEVDPDLPEDADASVHYFDVG